jgi:hypothetical protein
MSLLIANCPRCTARNTSFDLLANTYPENITDGFYHLKQYEAFCICRHCAASTIFVLRQKNRDSTAFLEKNALSNIQFSVNELFEIHGYISNKDAAATPAPEHLPANIEAAFNEGATCFAVGCFNAAGAMFRLCVDLASKELLPKNAPSKDTKMLAPRLKWLFEQNLLTEALHELSTCIKDDGNDGAHDGSLTKVEAEDLLEFTTLLLERIYTEPKKVQLAKERRTARNSQPT